MGISIQIFLTNQNLLPPPSAVANTVFNGIFHDQFISDSYFSIKRVIIGYFIGGTLGLILGLLSGLKKQTNDVLRPIIEFIRPIPPIAWIPLALLWFGFGDPPAYFLVALGAFFPIFSNAFLGITLVERGTVEVARCHGASKQFLFKKIILPQTLPSIFTGLRTGLGVAWMVVITAELVGAQSGLGYLIQISRAQLQGERVIAGMVLIGVIGFTLDYLMKMISERIMPWKKYGKGINYGEY
ncbi:MAG: ABC transporter permease [Saprospiraceae bacterium]|nr:ABC transporter permease [Saprospiraceae bacterium]